MCKTYSLEMARTWKDKQAIAKELIESIREIDKYEMEGLGFTTEQGVMASIYDTTPVFYAKAKDNGKLIACWGLQPLIGQTKNTYIIWALGTDEIERFRKSFVKESDAIIKRWADIYGELTNTVAVKNRRAIGWLKHLGAEFINKRTYNGVEYVDFIIRKKVD